LDEDGVYHISVYYQPNDEFEDTISIYDEVEVSFVDNSKFRVKSNDFISILDTNQVFFIYCPESSIGETITIQVNDYEFDFQIDDVSAGNYAGFTLNDLSLEMGENEIHILNDQGVDLIEPVFIELESPFRSYRFCTLPEDEDSRILDFNVPQGFDEGRIIITDENDTEIFNSRLADMEYDEDEGMRAYIILADDLNKAFAPGIHTFNAYYQGNISINKTFEMVFVEKHIIEKDNVTIEIFYYRTHNFADEDDVIAKVTTPNDEGYVKVVLIDEDNEKYGYRFRIWEDDGEYAAYVHMDDDRGMLAGIYQITVSYYDENGIEIVNLTDNVNFINSRNPFNVKINDEFDVNDDDAVVGSIHCPDETIGYFVFLLCDEDYNTLSNYTYEITDSDYNTVINVTVNNLNINEDGSYYILVYHIESLDDELNDETIIFRTQDPIDAIDYNKFRFISEMHEINLFAENNIFAVYCPDGQTGNITVRVFNEEEEEPFYNSTKSVNSKDENNKVHWNLLDLNIEYSGGFVVDVYWGDEIIQDGYEFNVHNPIGFNYESYINATDNYADLINIYLPSNITEGDIEINIDNSYYVQFNLSQFGNIDDGTDSPFWEYDEESEGDYKIYTIRNYHLNYDFEAEIEYNILVTLNINGRAPITKEREIELYARNVVSKDNITIEIFDANEFDLDDDEKTVVKITAPEGADGKVKIIIGDEIIFESDLREIDHNDDDEYFINVYDLKRLGSGQFNIIVEYYENHELILNNTATIRFVSDDDEDPDIFIPFTDDSDSQATYDINTDEMIIIYPREDDISEVRIIVVIDDEIYLNATLDDLDYHIDIDDEGETYYALGPVNFDKPISLGHHNIIAYYICGDYETDSVKSGDADFVDIMGIITEIDYRDVDTEVISVLCEHDTGKIILHFLDLDEDIEYEIQPGDEGNFITWTLQDLYDQLGLDLGNYYIEVSYEDEYLFDGNLVIVDNSKFRVITKCDSLFSDEYVVFVYCPVNSTGTIKLAGDEINTIEYVISPDDWGMYVGFDLFELGIMLPGVYEINATVDDEQIGEGTFELEVPIPFEFNENGIAIIGDGEEETMKVVSLFIPGGSTGHVIITCDGNIIFNKELYEIRYSDEEYVIFTSDLDSITEGNHLIEVEYEGIFDAKNMLFAQRNINISGDVSIEMIPADIRIWDWNDDYYFAIVTTDNEDGYVIVYINGEEYDVNLNDMKCEEIWDDDDNIIGYKYYLNPNKIANLKQGIYEAVVIYYDEFDTEIIRNNGEFKIHRDPEIFIQCSDWDARKVEYSPNDRNMIHIYPYSDDLESIRILVKIGDVVYLDEYLLDLGITPEVNGEGEVFYTIGPADFYMKLPFGHYDDLIAYYYSDNYVKDTLEYETIKECDIIGVLDEIEYTNTIDNVVAVLCDHQDGQYTIYIWNIDKTITYDVVPEDMGKFIYWNLNDLNLTVGSYGVEVRYNDNYMFSYDLLVVDNTKFRVKTECDWFYTTSDVLYVYCPENSEGIISIIDEEGNIVAQSNISDTDWNTYVGFNLNDLAIFSPGDYAFTVKVNDKLISNESFILNVPNPIELNKNDAICLYDGGEVTNDMKVASLNLPYNAIGNIIITIDGVEVFNKNLTQIPHSHGYYIIYSSDITFDDVGDYKVQIKYNSINTTKTMTFYHRNIVENGDVSIEVLPANIEKDNYDNRLYMAIVSSPTNNGKIKVLIDGVEYEVNGNVRYDEIWDEGRIIGFKYYINPVRCLDVELNPGQYDTTIIYYDENDDEILRNSVEFNVYTKPDIQVCFTGDWNKREAIFYLNQLGDSLVNFNYMGDLNPSDVRIILIADGVCLINNTIDKLSYRESTEGNYKHFNIEVKNIENITTGHYKNVFAYYITDKYEGSSKQSSLTATSFSLYNGLVDIHILNDNFDISENFVDIYAPVAADGNITIIINNETYFTGTLKGLGEINQFPEDVDVKSGHYYISFNNLTKTLTPGHYDNFMIYYNGNDGYNTDNTKSWDPRTSINVYGNSQITFTNNIEYTYGDKGTTTMILTGATVDLTNITVEESSGAIISIENNTITISGLNAGNYTLKVTTTPINEYYRSVDEYLPIKVNKKDSEITINDMEFLYGTTGNTTITLIGATVDLTNITIENHPEAIINLENNLITVSNLSIGTYTLKVTTTPNENYNSVTGTASITVISPELIDPNLTISVDGIVEGEDALIVVTTNATFTGEVKVTIGGNDYIVNVVGGYGNYSVSGLVADDYVAVATFNATNVFKESVKNITFTVSPKPVVLIDPNLTISVDGIVEGEDALIVVTTNATFTGDVGVTIGNGAYVVNVVGGYGNYSVSGLVADNYLAVATFTATSVFEASVKNTTFTVSPKPSVLIDPMLTINVADITEGQNAFVKITTNNTFSGNVSVKIDSTPYTVNVINGIGNISVSGINVGTHTAIAIFDQTTIFKPVTNSTTFKVNKKPDVIKLTLNKVKVKRSAKKLAIKATLTINGKKVKGKKIAFKFGKKSYKANTNSKGIAKITVKKSVLKKLKVGKKVTYTAKYLTAFAKKTVKVKR